MERCRFTKASFLIVLVVLCCAALAAPALAGTAGTISSWGDDWHDQVLDTPTESGFTAIAAGYWHSLALTADGRIVSWG